MREGDPSLVTFSFEELPDGKETFTIHVDRDKLRTSGFQALSDFLHKLHVYKSIGDYATAETFFNHYSQVDAIMLRIRDIVLANKVPRRIELQPNLFLNGTTVEYKGYESTFTGVISSFVERFSKSEIEPVYAEFMANQKIMRNWAKIIT